MRVKLPSGVILENENPEVLECWIQNGGVEVVEKATSTKSKKNKKSEDLEFE